MHADRGAELLPEAEQSRSGQLAGAHVRFVDEAGYGVAGYQGENGFAQGEHRHQGHDVGQGFVEGGLIGQRRLFEAPPQTVEDGVGRLVGDDVVRKRGVDGRRAGRFRRIEVAEQDGRRVRVVEGVCLGEGGRHEVELMTREAPAQPPAQRVLERL